MDIKDFIDEFGEKFQVHRGKEQLEAYGLANRDRNGATYIGFEPGTNIKAGDELRGEISGNVHQIVHIEHDVDSGRQFQLKAFYESHTARKPGGINVGSMVNSAIQQNSAGAVQTVSVTQEYRESSAEVIESVASILGQLELSDEDRNDLSAEIETVRAQLKLTRPKSAIIKSSLESVKSILESTATVAATAPLVSEIILRLGSLLHGG